MASENLTKAGKQKADEFCTQTVDIGNEMKHHKLKKTPFLHFCDLAGWCIISFAVMYCAILIFQICSPGFRFLLALQPLLKSNSLRNFLLIFLPLIIIYVKWVIPFLLKCKRPYFFIFELIFAVSIGTFVLQHFSIDPVSDFKSLADLAKNWQTLSQKEVEKQLIGSTTTHLLKRRCYFSYYMVYKLFGSKYIFLEISQLFMHLALGINVYFLAKQCINRETITRLSMILYFLMPVQYLYLTIPSLDVWGGALLCFNANLIIYLFKKCPKLQFYKREIESLPENKGQGMLSRIRSRFLSLSAPVRHVPWLLPLLTAILLGITLFWMEMVRNLQIILCLPMFIFLFAVVFRRILAGQIKFFSKTILFFAVLCLLVPFLSNKMMQKICKVTAYGSGEIPIATVMFNTPDEIREIVRFGDFQRITPESRKDFVLDASVSWWKNFPSQYARYLAIKMSYFSDLFNPMFVLTQRSGVKYYKEFAAYTFMSWLMKFILMPLILIGISALLFFKRWNSLAFVPVVLFFFFFFLMPTIGECQVRYTSLYYSMMCVCAACFILFFQQKVFLGRKKEMRKRFESSLLCGFCGIVLLFFAITSLFKSSAFSKKHQLIKFPKNLRGISSEKLPAAYKPDGKYTFSTVMTPVDSSAIPGKTSMEWVIPERTEEGKEYKLYGFLIAPLKNKADFTIKINGLPVWDNRVLAANGVPYYNSRIKITDGRIIFLNNLKFTAQKENILRVEIIPKNKAGVNFALSAWGMVQCK